MRVREQITECAMSYVKSLQADSSILGLLALVIVMSVVTGTSAIAQKLFRSAPVGGPGDRYVQTELHSTSRAGKEVSLQSFNFPDRFIRHRNSLGFVEPIPDELGKNDATFRIVSGLASDRCVSFESHDYPNQFLRNQAFRLTLAQFSDDPSFRKDATFCMVPGFAGDATTSFESFNYPSSLWRRDGRYIRHRNFELWLDRFDDTDQFKKDATFKITSPAAPPRVSPVYRTVPRSRQTPQPAGRPLPPP